VFQPIFIQSPSSSSKTARFSPIVASRFREPLPIDSLRSLAFRTGPRFRTSSIFLSRSPHAICDFAESHPDSMFEIATQDVLKTYIILCLNFRYTCCLRIFDIISHTTRSRLKVDYKLTREVKSQLLRSRMSTYIWLIVDECPKNSRLTVTWLSKLTINWLKVDSKTTFLS